MSFLEEIQDDLVLQGIGEIPPTSSSSVYAIILADWREDPDQQIVLFEFNVGSSGARVHDQPGEKYVRQGLEALVRGVPGDYAGARAKAYQIYSRWNGQIQNERLGSTDYLQVSATSLPTLFRRDDQDRSFIQVTAEAFKRPS